MEFKYNQELYSRQALLKAAFHFTDEYYIYLDMDDQYYIVKIEKKDGSKPEDHLFGLFTNEILNQATRESILEKTEDIRKMILGRAFASTVIEDDSLEDVQEIDTEENSLFDDWYEAKDAEIK